MTGEAEGRPPARAGSMATSAQNTPRLPQMIKLMSARQKQAVAVPTESSSSPHVAEDIPTPHVRRRGQSFQAEERGNAEPRLSLDRACDVAPALSSARTHVSQKDDAIREYTPLSSRDRYVSPWGESEGRSPVDGVLATEDGVTIKADVVYPSPSPRWEDKNGESTPSARKPKGPLPVSQEEAAPSSSVFHDKENNRTKPRPPLAPRDVASNSNQTAAKPAAGDQNTDASKRRGHGKIPVLLGAQRGGAGHKYRLPGIKQPPQPPPKQQFHQKDQTQQQPPTQQPPAPDHLSPATCPVLFSAEPPSLPLPPLPLTCASLFTIAEAPDPPPSSRDLAAVTCHEIIMLTPRDSLHPHPSLSSSFPFDHPPRVTAASSGSGRDIALGSLNEARGWERHRRHSRGSVISSLSVNTEFQEITPQPSPRVDPDPPPQHDPWTPKSHPFSPPAAPSEARGSGDEEWPQLEWSRALSGPAAPVEGAEWSDEEGGGGGRGHHPDVHFATVVNWLREMGLSELEDVFCALGVSLFQLAGATDGQLQDLGVVKMGHRAKLLRRARAECLLRESSLMSLSHPQRTPHMSRLWLAQQHAALPTAHRRTDHDVTEDVTEEGTEEVTEDVTEDVTEEDGEEEEEEPEEEWAGGGRLSSPSDRKGGPHDGGASGEVSSQDLKWLVAATAAKQREARRHREQARMELDMCRRHLRDPEIMLLAASLQQDTRIEHQ